MRAARVAPLPRSRPPWCAVGPGDDLRPHTSGAQVPPRPPYAAGTGSGAVTGSTVQSGCPGMGGVVSS